MLLQRGGVGGSESFEDDLLKGGNVDFVVVFLWCVWVGCLY